MNKLSYLLRMLSVVIIVNSAQSHTLHVTNDSFVDESMPSSVMDVQDKRKRGLILADLDSQYNNLDAGERIILLRYDMTTLSDEITSESVGKASLRLWISDVEKEGKVILHLIKEDWNERTVTWVNKPQIETNSFITIVDITTDDARRWKSIDITQAVKQWLILPSQNYGVALKVLTNQPGSDDAIIEVGTKEGILIAAEGNINQLKTSTCSLKTCTTPTPAEIEGPITHPSEIEVSVLGGTDFDFQLIGSSSNEIQGQEQGIYVEETSIVTSIDLPTQRYAMYQGTVSMLWEQDGHFTASCRGRLYENDRLISITPAFNQDMSNLVKTHTFSIMGSSKSQTVSGNVRAEVICHLLTQEGDVVEHSTNGNLHLWSTVQ